MNLFFNGQPMSDDQTLATYNLMDQSTIDLDFGLDGGKVHGSLARAGKVKGQTPKVSIDANNLKNFLFLFKNFS